MTKIKIVLLIAAAFILHGTVGCGRNEETEASKRIEKVTLAVTPWPASAAIFIAYENGYFRDEGLDVTLQRYLSGHLGLAAVLAGKADMVTVGETPLARAVLDGKPLAIVATICEIDRAIRIIARKDRGISAPADLKGRRIGVVAGTTAEFFLRAYLTTFYIHPEDVRMVDIETDKLVDALLSGAVDAVSTWSPFTAVLRDRLGSNAATLDSLNIYTMSWNIAATQTFARNNSACIRKFLRAVLRANSFIKDHPAETRTVTAKHIGSDSPLYEQEWQDYEFNLELNQGLIVNLEDQARWMIKTATGGRRPDDFTDFIYTEGLNAVKPGGVAIVGK